MTKTDNKYSLNVYKKLVVLCFLFNIMANPVVKIFNVFNNSVYEWVDTVEKETSKEKEYSKDLEDKNIEHIYPTQFVYCTENSKSSLFFIEVEYSDNLLEIFLPPPELS